MKKSFLTLIIFAAAAGGLFAEDYQYQYFTEEKDTFVPFSDYIPRVRMHYETVPHYVEDFYRLYGMKMYYNENTLRQNIVRLKESLTRKFRHPSQALVKVESAEEYLKYRKLMFMHINLLITRNYLKIATRYDQQNIHFHSQPFAKEINESLDIAEQYYKKAIPYWKAAKKYALEANRIKLTTALGKMESERYSIARNELDYDKIIGDHLLRLKGKRRQLAPWLAEK